MHKKIIVLVALGMLFGSVPQAQAKSMLCEVESGVSHGAMFGSVPFAWGLLSPLAIITVPVGLVTGTVVGIVKGVLPDSEVDTRKKQDGQQEYCGV